MNRQDTVKAFAIAVALPTLLLGTSIRASSETSVGQSATAQRVPQTVPKATCGRMDRIETGLQGQTTPDERSSGKSKGGYNCNLELVGQFQGEGAFSQDGPAFLDNCALSSSWSSTSSICCSNAASAPLGTINPFLPGFR